ncbi:MAG: ester cyclase [Acidimicrobiia bacterium]|nr:ester cyclase [Acidimicrobiia bacterium]
MTDHRETIRRLNLDVFGKGNVGVIDEILHEDFVDHTGMQGPMDREATKQFVQQIHGALSDTETTVDHILVDGDRVAWRWHMKGTHTGDFMGVPPTNDTIEVSGNDIGIMRDGKLAEMWSEVDNLSLFSQLGIVNPPPFMS